VLPVLVVRENVMEKKRNLLSRHEKVRTIHGIRKESIKKNKGRGNMKCTRGLQYHGKA